MEESCCSNSCQQDFNGAKLFPDDYAWKYYLMETKINVYTNYWDIKWKVLQQGNFPHNGDPRVYIELLGKKFSSSSSPFQTAYQVI
jgi:hypothetical protein